MIKIDWHKRWQENRIGFHQAATNAYLKKYLNLFHLNAGDSIFLPLCGKAFDIIWLAQQGFQVIGIEISQIAIEAFFEEQQLAFEIINQDRFKLYQAQNIKLLQGDFFDLNESDLQQVKLVYDRASLIAIEAENRQNYSNHISRISAGKTPMLLITLEYDQNVMSGPPFSVPKKEIEQYYTETYQIDYLESNEEINERPRWREMGLSSLMETAIHLTPKNNA